MISIDYIRVMAKYNHWQNNSLICAANSLNDDQRWEDRGAFFSSIARTFNHLLWDDHLWIARFEGDEKPEKHIHATLNKPRNWVEFEELRQQTDAVLIDWSNQLSKNALNGDLHWFPGGGDGRVTKQKWLCAVHLFNHQTHHRGQIHSMLTAFGVQPEPTDLPMTPDLEQA